MKEGWMKGLVFRDQGGRKEEQRREELREIPVDSILFNPHQPRKEFPESELEELAESIREHGVLQPVLVRPYKKGYELVAGERRVRACKRLGLKTIPAIIRELTDQEAAVLCLIENLQREELSFLEEAIGYENLIKGFNMTQEQIAATVGKRQSTVANKLRLLRLPEEVREVIRKNSISERHARALLMLPDAASQLDVLGRVVSEGLTVRETEALVEGLCGGRPAESRRGKGARTRKVIRVFKDLRLFLNSFRQAVTVLRRAGVDAKMEEADLGEFIEVRVLIPKRAAKQRAAGTERSGSGKRGAVQAAAREDGG